jgi:hypothetical protein
VSACGETYEALSARLEGVEYWQPDWDDVIVTLDDDVRAYDRIVLGNRPG